MSKKNYFIIMFLFLTFSLMVFSADVIEELDDSSDLSLETSEFITEKIFKISASGRIWILTNNSGSLLKGDFISIVYKEELVFRAVVAKLMSNLAGIKILKIYLPDLYKELKPDMMVQIIRGDDSFYKNRKVETLDELKLKTEDNLFDNTLIDENIALEGNSKRVIKQDNVLSVLYTWVEGVDNDGVVQKYGQFMGQWAYQFYDNVFAELGYGQNIINDFPTLGLDTRLNNIIVRVKYTFQIPFYSFIQPYLGYQIIRVDSPKAGIRDADDTSTTEEELKNELRLIDNVEKNSIAFGVTILKRLVPGWFLKLDAGSDIICIGFGVEF